MRRECIIFFKYFLKFCLNLLFGWSYSLWLCNWRLFAKIFFIKYIDLLKDLTYNSTLYKNAGFSLDKSYVIFPQILWFSAIFPSPWYFYPAILSAVVFFRNTVQRQVGKIPCLKIDRDLKIVVFYIPMLSGFIFR
jgi:hypothetical protein